MKDRKILLALTAILITTPLINRYTMDSEDEIEIPIENTINNNQDSKWIEKKIKEISDKYKSWLKNIRLNLNKNNLFKTAKEDVLKGFKEIISSTIREIMQLYNEIEK